MAVSSKGPNTTTTTPAHPPSPTLSRPGFLGVAPSSPNGNGNLAGLNPNGVSKPPAPPKSNLKLFQPNNLASQFRLLVLVCLLLVGLALGLSFWSLNNLYQNVYSIVSNSAPSVKTAQDLGQAIQNADTTAANYQLYFHTDVTSPDFNPKIYGTCQRDNSGNSVSGLRECAWQDFLDSRQQVSNLLYSARQNITYPGEADAINAITNRFFDYFGRITIVKTELEQDHREAALAVYKSAEDLLTGNLNNVPLDNQGHSPEEQLKLSGWQGFDITKQYLGIDANVHKLFQVNQNYLDKAYADAKGSIALYTVLVIVACGLLILSLLFLSVRYALITHRVLSPGYTPALIGAGLLSYFLVNALLTTNNSFSQLQASFTEVNAVAQARLLLADGNADESRVLLSPESLDLDSSNATLTADVRQRFNSQTLKANFVAKQQLVMAALTIAWNNATDSDATDLCKVTPQPGSNASGCANTDFALNTYLGIDSNIRQAFNSGLLAKAISIDIGYQPPDGSDYYFNIVDNALIHLSSTNVEAFDSAACTAVGSTNSGPGTTGLGSKCSSSGYIPLLQVSLWIVFPLIAASTLFGFWFIRNEF